MSETQQTDKEATPAPETEPEDVYLFYEDVKTNPGPGEFVMHGVSLFFSRGKVTGPVTATIAGIVTGRKKPPAIRIATDAEKPAAAPTATGAVVTKTDDQKTDDSKTEGQQTTTNGTTGTADPDPNAKAQTERRPKAGTSLATG